MAEGGYSTRVAARLLGVPQSQVRSYVRAGFVAPQRDPTGGYRLSFKDLVVLRVAAGLTNGVTPRRVHRALRRLRNQIGERRGLSELNISARDGRVIVRDGASTWNPESGQLLLDLDVDGRETTVAPLATKRESLDRRAAEDWYEHAVEIEESDPAGARAAYERALELDPGHADAHIDLGHLLHEQGDAAGAETHYRRALATRPEDATASYNLGVALEDLGRKEEAIGAYEQAIRFDPRLADAYWNLGELYHQQGRGQAALRAMKSYLTLTKNWPR